MVAAAAWDAAHPPPVPCACVAQVVRLPDGVVAEVVWDGGMRRYGEVGGLLPPRETPHGRWDTLLDHLAGLGDGEGAS